MEKKTTKLIGIAMIVFSGLNILDLIMTTAYYQYEINPLVINNYPAFYIIKYITTFIILTIGIYKLSIIED